MKYELAHIVNYDPKEGIGYHRGSMVMRFVVIDGYDAFSFKIGGICAMVCEVQDKGWWIVATDPDEDKVFQDVGPFDDIDEVMVTFKLMTEVAND